MFSLRYVRAFVTTLYLEGGLWPRLLVYCRRFSVRPREYAFKRNFIRYGLIRGNIRVFFHVLSSAGDLGVQVSSTWLPCTIPAEVRARNATGLVSAVLYSVLDHELHGSQYVRGEEYLLLL